MYNLPLIEDKLDKNFWYDYNRYHALDHQEMASWINAFAKTKNLDLQITYYNLPPFDPKDERLITTFFDTNWKQHQMYYDFLNQIGKSLTIPVFIFPRNYPSNVWDLDVESFLKLEKDIHNTLWRSIDVIRNNL